MEAHQLNLPASIGLSIESGRVTWGWPLLMIFARTILFTLTGLIIIGIMAATGRPDPLAAYLPWWPFQVIATNLVIIPLLRYLGRREGIGLGAMVGYRPGFVKKDLLQAAALLIPGFLFGMLGLFGASLLIWGTPPSQAMFQPLPLAAAVAATVLLPLTNGLAETTTYMGYALPRLEALTKGRWGALTLAAVGLSIQHVAFPLSLDPKFILWRLVAFLPLAFFVGLVYQRTRRMVPLMLVHAVMDLQLVATVLMLSL